jgi:hypothetical protein
MAIESGNWLALAARPHLLGPNGKVVLTTSPPDAQVLFNIGGPALNQLNDTAQKNKLQAKRSVAAGLGLTAASLLAAQSADAAEIAQVMLYHCSRTIGGLSVLSKLAWAPVYSSHYSQIVARSGRGW